jgi:DNA-binding MarR family transcriptional regulator
MTKASSHLPLYETPADLRLRTWVQLARTFLLIQRQVVAALARHEITLPQFDLLATLRFSEGVTQQELAGRLLVTKGNVCGLLDRLEKLRWVERRPDPDDGRANRLHLTHEGRALIERLLPEHDSLILGIFGRVPTARLNVLRQALEELEPT